MAKRQNLSLNPSKISGQCGRLLCCLAYEDDRYKKKRSPGPRGKPPCSKSRHRSKNRIAGGAR